MIVYVHFKGRQTLIFKKISPKDMLIDLREKVREGKRERNVSMREGH